MVANFRGSIDCPHCQGALRVRSSRREVATLKLVNWQCSNVECGATFAGRIEITHGISPSAIADPNVHIRMVAPRRREAANDNGEGAPVILPSGPEVPLPRAANDDDRCGEAVATGT